MHRHPETSSRKNSDRTPEGLYRPFSRGDLLRLMTPIVVEQSLATLVGLVSTIMVAVVGESAVSGVSMVEFIMAFFFAVFAALSAGGTVICGQYLGRGERGKARGAADQLLRFSVLTGLAVTCAVWFSRDIILDGIFGSIEPDVRQDALTYLNLVLFAIPSMPVYCACAAIFRTVGSTRLPMFASMVMGFLNMSGAGLAVYVLDAGTFGVGVANLISRWAACVFLLVLCCTRSFSLRPYLRLTVPLRWGVIVRILRIGVPFGFENGLFHVGRIAILGLVATYGTSAIAANAVAGTLCFFLVLPGMSVCLGGTAVISRCVGAGDYEAARHYTRALLKLAYAAHLAVALFALPVLPHVLALYGLPADTTATAHTIVLWHLVMDVIFWPLAFCLPITFRSAGDARYPMVVAILDMFLCRVFLAWVFGTVFGMGVLGTWYAMFCDWVVRVIFFVHRYRGTRWTTFRSI